MKINTSRLIQFWELVVEEASPRPPFGSSCWTWIGPRSNQYGSFGGVMAHSAAAAIYCREAPSRVSHRCKNSLCVNLAHLSISLMKDRPRKTSVLTGRPLAPGVTEDQQLIKSILDARGVDHSNPHFRKAMGNQRVSDTDIARKCGCGLATVKRVMHLAPLYDLIDEIKAKVAKGDKYPVEPIKHESHIYGHDMAMFQSALAFQTGETSNA